jgi:hypothetical protein
MCTTSVKLDCASSTLSQILRSAAFAAPLQAEQDERVTAKLAQDSQVMEVLLEEVLPRALHLFISGPLQVCLGSMD